MLTFWTKASAIPPANIPVDDSQQASVHGVLQCRQWPSTVLICLRTYHFIKQVKLTMWTNLDSISFRATSRATHLLMRRFCDIEYCDENRYVEMAKLAAVSCIHNCIQTVYGGSRIDFPKNKTQPHCYCCHTGKLVVKYSIELSILAIFENQP